MKIISGIVERGNRVGTELGYPTANVALGGDVAEGVWAAWAEVDGVRYGAMVSIGRRETIVDKGKKVLEAHLFDFSGDLYGKTISVELLEKIRDQRKFDNIASLRKAIEEDEQKIRKFLIPNS